MLAIELLIFLCGGKEIKTRSGRHDVSPSCLNDIVMVVVG